MEYNFCTILEKQKRVDIYLSTLFKDFSRSYIQKMIDRGQLCINGKCIKKNIKISNKDEILLKIISTSIAVEAEDIDLDIVYEDENILIVNKQSNFNVHPVPGENGNKGTLVNAVLFHCKDKLPTIGGENRPGIVHRLDKNTTGVIMVAKNDKMMNYLSNIIKNREIDKYYIAIVHGVVKEHNFTIEAYIGRDKYNRQKMTISNPVNPKISITHGTVIDYIDNKYSILRIKLETGRTHQIRVHLASIGHAILGDNTYGNSKINREVTTKYQLRRQALHAISLEFELYGKTRKFEGKLKNDMMKLIGDIKI